MMKRIGECVALAAAVAQLAAGTAFAQVEPREPPVWQMDRSGRFCTLIRLPDPGAPFHVALRATPASGTLSLMLIAGKTQGLPAQISTIALMPSGRTFDVSGNAAEGLPDTRALWLGPLPLEFRGALAESSAIELRNGSEVRYRIPLSYVEPASQALRQCAIDVARGWGVDETALEALHQRPRTTNLFGINWSDYPSPALRRRIQGRVVVRITVSPEGRATQCAPVGPSTYPPLDSGTCRLILEKAQFAPALDSSDRPVEATIIGSVLWRMPG